ncbi:MAG: hypothetical protein SFV81_17440 [Pirellulaceae bacterium]|nr:hypothetical protein [Pirellulaceae bacterium]
MKRTLGSWVSFAAAFMLSTTIAVADPPARVLLPPGLAESQLRHVNSVGEAVGRCEIFDASQNSIADFVCLFSNELVTPLPKLEHYRKMECSAISDSGKIVGYAYSPVRKECPPLQAFLFDRQSTVALPLPSLSSNSASLATAISSDGKTIAGVCDGQACVWEYNGSSWIVAALPQNAPGLSTQKVCLSDSGMIAVAFQRGAKSAELVLWRRDELAAWQRSHCLETEVSPCDVNNAATIVGSKDIVLDGRLVTRGFVLRAAQDSTPQDIELIAPFEGDNFSTARSINNQGVVVGWSDGVGDKSKWPRSFVWKGSKAQSLAVGPATSPSQAFGINDHDDVVGLLEREKDPHAVGFVLRITEMP